MVRLVHAVDSLSRAGIARYAVVGGVAVAARLRAAHRATTDVDTVVDETIPPDPVTALAALPGAEPDAAAAHRVRLHGTKVEVLPVAPIEAADLAGLPSRQALFVASHWWALDTATPLTLVAGSDPSVVATAPFASAAALVAMKLHAIQDRSPASEHKRAGDAWDLFRLLADLDADGSIRAAIAEAGSGLRALVHEAVLHVLVTNAARTRAWLRAGDDIMATVTVDDLRFVGRRLGDAIG